MSQQEIGFLLRRLRQHEAKLSKQLHLIDRNAINPDCYTEAPLACHTAICSAKSTSSHLTPLFHHPIPIFFFAFLVYSQDIKNKFIKKSSIFTLCCTWMLSVSGAVIQKNCIREGRYVSQSRAVTSFGHIPRKQHLMCFTIENSVCLVCLFPARKFHISLRPSKPTGSASPVKLHVLYLWLSNPQM